MAKKKEVVITCNATNVKAVIDGLERGMAALAKEEEKLLNTIKQRGYAENDEKKRLKGRWTPCAPTCRRTARNKRSWAR